MNYTQATGTTKGQGADDGAREKDAASDVDGQGQGQGDDSDGWPRLAIDTYASNATKKKASASEDLGGMADTELAFDVNRAKTFLDDLWRLG